MSKKHASEETNRQLKRVTDDGKSLRVKLVDEDNADITSANPLEVNATIASGSVSTKETPDATSTYSPDSDVSATYEASSISKASAGVFYGLHGYNSRTSLQIILIYNSTTVPADGAVTPIVVISVPATSSFSFDAVKFGMYFSTGISWSNSTASTPFTKILGAADCFINLQYK